MIVVDIDENGLSNEKVMFDGWVIVGGVCWSLDGCYLLYFFFDLDFNLEVYIYFIDGSWELVNVSMYLCIDYCFYWSVDGSKFGFVFICNNGDFDLWFVWLWEVDW